MTTIASDSPETCGIIRSERLAFSWTQHGLTLIDTASGRAIFRNATVRLTDYAGNTRHLLQGCPFELVGNTARACVRVEALEIELRYALSEQYLRCEVAITNRGAVPCQLGDLDFLCFDRKAGSVSHLLAAPFQVYSLGAVTAQSEQMWSTHPRNKRVFALTMGPDEQHYASDNLFCARPLASPELTPEVTFSFDRIGEVASGVVIDLKAGISRVRSAFRGASLPPGARRDLPSLYVDGISPAHDAIEAATDRVAAIYRPQLPARIPNGWCSWYYYYVHVTEADILENLRFLADRRDRFPLEYVQIDDGYQKHWGDWLQPSGKFPHDMAYIARQIKALGFKPGIWVAPLIMTEPSDLFRDHPEWALKHFETGQPYTMTGWSPKEENPWVLIDGSNPEFLQHLKKMFTVMAHEWGYDYFKLDAMAFGAYAGLRHRPDLTGEQTLRLVLETVREAIGPDKYILGCGVPFGSAVGIVDGERVSDDVSTAFRRDQYFCPMETALAQTIHRSVIHGKWWHNDPDCVLTRSHGTPHEEALNASGLSLEEARFFVTVVGLTQGIQMIGESMKGLEPERLALLETIQPPMPFPAKSLDLFVTQPERLLTTTAHGRLLALLNWQHEPKRFSISTNVLGPTSSEPQEIYELWTDRHLGTLGSSPLDIEVPAQGCRVIYLKPSVTHPAFLGFNGHISCGSTLLQSETWDPETNTLQLVLGVNRPAQLKLVVPTGWVPLHTGLRQTGPCEWTASVEKGMPHLGYGFRKVSPVH